MIAPGRRAVSFAPTLVRGAAAIWLAALLGGCAPRAIAPIPNDPDALAAVSARTQVIGVAVRAAAACNLPLSMAAQDQAARLETAVITVHAAAGGVAERDAFLATMRPPRASTKRARAAWCRAQRPDLAGVEGFLAGPDGAALIARAEAMTR